MKFLVKMASFSSSKRPFKNGMSRCSLVKRSEEHTSELQSREKLVCRLLLEKTNPSEHYPDRCEASCPASPASRPEGTTDCTASRAASPDAGIRPAPDCTRLSRPSSTPTASL